MKPTRIIKKPWYKQDGIRRYCQIHCDDDVIYTVQELADIFGKKPQYISFIIRTRGWNNPKVFEFKGRWKAKRALPPLETYEQQSPYKVIIPGDLAHLSATHNRYGMRVY